MNSWYLYLRSLLIDILIRIIEHHLYKTPVPKLDAEKMQNFYADMFERADFRQYCIDRETRIIHSLANKWDEGVKGQRFENMLFFEKARIAHEKRQEK